MAPSVHYSLFSKSLSAWDTAGKKTLHASEQNREDVKKQREKWKKKQTDMVGKRLVFLDESGAKTNMTRRYARAKGGERANDFAPVGHWETTTMIGAMRLDGTTPTMILPGATDHLAFMVYLERVLVPTLKKGDVVIMDNLPAHKSSKITELIESRKASCVYLPPYSPDFNPIEKMWSKIKEFLRAFKARSEHELHEGIKQALASVTPSDCQGWFQSCGYEVP